MLKVDRKLGVADVVGCGMAGDIGLAAIGEPILAAAAVRAGAD